jgi:hypothetical protein
MDTDCPNLRIRRDAAGELEEMAGEECDVHLEQMSETEWWMGVEKDGYCEHVWFYEVQGGVESFSRARRRLPAMAGWATTPWTTSFSSSATCACAGREERIGASPSRRPAAGETAGSIRSKAACIRFRADDPDPTDLPPPLSGRLPVSDELPPRVHQPQWASG